MYKLFIGLLIVAAGAGVFFLLRKKKNSTNASTINKEWIIGKWKIDSLKLPVDDTLFDMERSGLGLDSNYKKYTYTFSSDGAIFRNLRDSGKTDTSFYKWTDSLSLRWSRIQADTITTSMKVKQLTKDSLFLDAGNGYVNLIKQD